LSEILIAKVDPTIARTAAAKPMRKRLDRVVEAPRESEASLLSGELNSTTAPLGK
jgi:hypothetical protein